MTTQADREARAREVLAKHGLVDGFNLPVLPGYTVAVDPDAVVAAVADAFATPPVAGIEDAPECLCPCHKPGRAMMHIKPCCGRAESKRIDAPDFALTHPDTYALANAVSKDAGGDERVEWLNEACGLIQEAKGFADGPEGSAVSDHLDFAEHWIDKVIAALSAPPPVQAGEVLPSHPRANVRPAYTDAMVGLLDAYEQAIWTWAQGCEIDGINQRSMIGDSYNESQRADAAKARSALIQQIDALTTTPVEQPIEDRIRAEERERCARAGFDAATKMLDDSIALGDWRFAEHRENAIAAALRQSGADKRGETA